MNRMLLLTLLLANLQPGMAARQPGAPSNYTAYRVNALKSHFPNVPLVTQDGRRVRFYDDLIKGKTVMIQFMFANCEKLCPMTTPNLVKVQSKLAAHSAANVTMISITVDPEHDTPAALKQYSRRFHVRPGWQFLTGKRADIDLIRRQLGVYDPDDQRTAHMNVLTIGREPTGNWLAIEALARPDDIVATALRVASAGSPARH